MLWYNVFREIGTIQELLTHKGPEQPIVGCSPVQAEGGSLPRSVYAVCVDIGRMKIEQCTALFSERMRWPTHRQHLGIGNPGVYLLARFTGSAPASRDPVDSNVLYVGETCRQSLKTRLYQFSRSAFYRKEGHSGGWTFCDTFNRERPADPPDWLFVSILPVRLEEPKRSALIRLIERQIMWDFVCKWDRLPQCNTK